MNALVQTTTRQYCSFLADLAVNALIDEVNLTPKPALVDQRGSGAHQDLTLQLMERSARSLQPMFEAMAQAALDHGFVSQGLREEIGKIGRDGEVTMLQETQGINTHRGAIWALGLLVTATALNSLKATAIKAGEICQCAAELACLEDRFIPKHNETHGQYVHKKYGAGGAKLQAQLGFPVVMQYGLPQLRASRIQHNHELAAQVDSLLAMMTTLRDTCVLYRAGEVGLKRMHMGAQCVLDLGGYATITGKRALQILEMDLMLLNASPGGVADLFAVTLFIDRVEQL
ncbi:triphosphoribosyl-dephospho-CoA synthase [Acinetobacter sp. ANC 3781]